MGSSDFAGALAPGTKLHEYEIVRLLGRPGGFGMTYLAVDANLGKTVAVKEYLPVDYAVRSTSNSVSLRSRQDQKAFDWGRSAFIKEARVLARFKHRNVVSVHRFFEANETAYIVMEYVQGETLGERLLRDTFLDQPALLDVLMPVLDGLAHVHEDGVLHRDIKPDNIVITPAGVPVLIDFGAARNELSNRSRSAMNVFTAGYAPIEQYSDHDSQGVWTDIYALGAIAYRAITGNKPVDAIARMTGTRLGSARELGAGRYTEQLLAAVDWALELKPENRPPNLQVWKARLLAGGMDAPPSSAQTPVPSTDVELDFDLSDSDDSTLLADDRDRIVNASSRAMAFAGNAKLDETIQGYIASESSVADEVADVPELRAHRRGAGARAGRSGSGAVPGLAEKLSSLQSSTVRLWRERPTWMIAGAALMLLLVIGLAWLLRAPASSPAPGIASVDVAPPDAGVTSTPVVSAPEPEPTLPAYPAAASPQAATPEVAVASPTPEKRKPAAVVAPEQQRKSPPVMSPQQAEKASPSQRPTQDKAVERDLLASTNAPGSITVLTPSSPPVFEVTTPPAAPEAPVETAVATAAPPQPSLAPSMIATLQQQLNGFWRADNKVTATLGDAACKVEIERVWDLRFNALTSDKQHLDGKFLVESTVVSEAADGCPAYRVKVNERGTFLSADERSDAVLLILHSFGCIGVDCEKVRDLPMFRSGKTEAQVTFMVPPRSLRFAREKEDLVFRNGS